MTDRLQPIDEAWSKHEIFLSMPAPRMAVYVHGEYRPGEDCPVLLRTEPSIRAIIVRNRPE
jgi:hypothetical protein